MAHPRLKSGGNSHRSTVVVCDSFSAWTDNGGISPSSHCFLPRLSILYQPHQRRSAACAMLPIDAVSSACSSAATGTWAGIGQAVHPCRGPPVVELPGTAPGSRRVQ